MIRYLLFFLLILAQDLEAYAQGGQTFDALRYQEILESMFLRDSFRFDSTRLLVYNNERFVVATGYRRTSNNDELLYGYLFSLEARERSPVLIDSQGINGGLAELVTIFAANADADRDDELIALFRWRIRHYETEGYIFEVRAYDRPERESLRLQPLPKQPEINCGFEGYRAGRRLHARYNTETRIRKRLRQLGFR